MATLEQVFQREKAWIAACADVDALSEKIGDWRDSAREAERDGDQLLRMRAQDLVELARSRVVRLQKGAIQAEEARSLRVATPPAVPTGPAAEPSRQPSRDRVAERRPDDGAARREQESRDAERRAKTEAALAETEKAKAAARLAEAEAARIEAQTALLREQTEAARRVAVAPATTATPSAKSPTHQGPARTKPVDLTGGPSPTATPASRPTAARMTPAPRKQPSVPRHDHGGYTEADRLALASVGHWPPTPPAHRGAFWTKHDDWPRDWTLTGGDLGRFRGEVNLTRAVFAAQLGVPSAAVKDAEMNPRERVGPALQIALRRAMDHAAEERRRRREERAAAAARPEPAVAAEVATATPEVPASGPASGAPAASATFTGADLARLRAERRLTQKEMADLLGVEQGTISKGEAKAGAALGPALQEAVARLGREPAREAHR